MIYTFIIIISFLFDGLLTNYLPYLVGDLSYFTPMFTITSILFLSPFFRKQEKDYYIVLFVVGLFYDLFYTNLFLYHGSLFIILGFISYQLQKTFGYGFFKNILFIILLIVVYELLTVGFLLLYNMVPITIYDIIYKITHSLALNIIYGEIIYFIIRLIPEKYKKISIN